MKFAAIMLAFVASISALATPVFTGPKGQKYYTGYVKPENHGFGMPYFSLDEHFRVTELPEKFDWRENGLETPVRNQGNCGSCWAFASVQTLEGATARVGEHQDLSEQQVTSCYTKAYGCNGGWFAGSLLVNPGVTTEAEYPYKAVTGKCRKDINPVAKALSYGFVGEQGRAPKTNEIKQAIMQYGHISVTVSAGNAWSNYTGGTFKGCKNGQTNHMVTLVGWHMENGKTVWHMKNSWGTSWGDKGYMNIPEGCDRIGEEAAFVTYKDSTPCEPPKAKLPAAVMVNKGDEVAYAVKAQSGVDYTWLVDNKQVATGPVAYLVFEKDTSLKLVGKNNCGKVEVATKITVRK